MRRVDLAEDALDFAGFDGVFHLAGQPGVRSFGDVFALYLRRNVLATQRVFEAAVARRREGRLRVARPRSTATRSATRRPRTPRRGRTLPYGITKLALRAPARHLRARVRAATPSRCATSRVYGPRQRPDMAFARIVARARARAAVRGLRRRLAVALFDVRGRRRRRDDRARSSAAPGIYNVGGGDRGVDERGARAARGDRRPPARVTLGPPQAGRHAAHEGRHDAASSAELGWQPPRSLARRSRRALGLGLESPGDGHDPDDRARPRRRARDRPRPLAPARSTALWWLARCRARRWARSSACSLAAGGTTSYKATVADLARPAGLARRRRDRGLRHEPAGRSREITSSASAQDAGRARRRACTRAALRGKVSVGTVGVATGAGAARTAPLISLTVQGKIGQTHRRTRRTRSHAIVVADTTAPYVGTKIATYNQVLDDRRTPARLDQPAARRHCRRRSRSRRISTRSTSSCSSARSTTPSSGRATCSTRRRRRSSSSPSPTNVESAKVDHEPAAVGDVVGALAEAPSLVDRRADRADPRRDRGDPVDGRIGRLTPA